MFETIKILQCHKCQRCRTFQPIFDMKESVQLSLNQSMISILTISRYLRRTKSQINLIHCSAMQLFVPVQHKTKQLNKVKSLPTKAKAKSESFLVATWKSFARHTSIHSVHYLTENSISLMEKLLWAVAILSAFVTMAYCCILLSNRFKTSLISTVFESTNYKVSEVPFPAVHLCSQNRLNYNKTNEAVEKFFPNRSKDETETFVTFLKIMQNMDYGSYDEFEVIRQNNVTEINKLNLTEVYVFMMLDCEVFFVSCSWKKVPFNCCDLISRQITEFGICWSFNSATNVGSEHVNVRCCC